MSRKVRRVPVVLDAGEIRDLPMEDIRVILRDADELVRIAEVENTIKNRAKLSEQKRVRICRELESEVS